ncbi:peptidoglycan-binding protein [Leptolyngbya sp. FACHB-711]|uniref:peptidoglycan-binding domain-containing protein n=1 Tax=unclassified Leptolyngbya TaxID=2650499 RepID=UPI0016851477|nr:peptidoglycan-binding protein [Leptolyngbya sp. FACHB-711]MBD1851409.1 peptidoglycan-binding protein [Cyanobacteria bacterium FACHB-502]MBD2024362.1 peptidoglycan-binding protein [Leptolyngbya sp. FACHB-711]
MTTLRSTVLLKKGSQGSGVKQLQAMLNVWLESSEIFPGALLVEDGIFGLATEGIIKFFQCRHFLEMDGIVGTQMMACLNQGVSGLPLLKQGSTGAIVRRLQQVLTLYGINLGSVDGIYGTKTRAAVTHFQNDHHIFDVNGHATGEVNLNTWRKLAEEPVGMACGPLRSFS